MKCEEFYQFFIEHESLSDAEIADKAIARLGLKVGPKFSRATIIDLVTTTRMARSRL